MARTDTDLDYQLYDITAAITGTTKPATTFQYVKDGSPIDLTGYSIDLNIVKFEGATPVKTYSIGSGLTLSDPTNGIFTWDEFLIDLDAGEYLHETLLTSATGDKQRYLRGRWTIKENRS